jgi:hypothetical protein
LKSKFPILLLVICLATKVHGQTYNHTSFWSRLGFQKQVKKFDFKLEFDYRTQNDFRKSANNPFQQHFLKWFRFSSTYKTGKFSHTIILPNLAETYPLVANTADLKRLPTKEWRYSFLEEMSLPYKKLTTSFRAGYEFRHQTNNNISKNTGRFRFRINETLQLSKKSKINLSFESLYNIGPNKAPNTFSQTQTQLRFSQQFGKKVTLQTGFLHLYRKRSNLVEFDLENGLLCNLQIGL